MATTPQETPEKDSIPFFPDHVRTEFFVVIGVTVILFIIGILGQIRPVGLEDPADPLNTPLHIKPEWYFLGLYQLLKFVPKVAGVMIPIVGLLVVMIWPFLDRRPDTKRARLIRAIGAIIFVVALVAMTLWGAS